MAYLRILNIVPCAIQENFVVYEDHKGRVAAVMFHLASGRRVSVPVCKKHLGESPVAAAVTVDNRKCVDAEVSLVDHSFGDRATLTVHRF